MIRQIIHFHVLLSRLDVVKLSADVSTVVTVKTLSVLLERERYNFSLILSLSTSKFLIVFCRILVLLNLRLLLPSQVYMNALGL